MNNLEIAVSKVDYDFYSVDPEGSKIPQTSNPAIISSMLKLLDVNKGDSVLEIGTGSGYSTALLAELVGASGKVVSIDIVPDLVSRACEIFEKQRLHFVKVIQGDGRKGSLNEAPFDHVVTWAAGEFISPHLIDQLSSEGTIVAPIKLNPLLDSTVVVRLKKSRETLIGDKVIYGGFVNFSDDPQENWTGPYEDADVLLVENDVPYFGISANWIKELETNTITKQIYKLFYANVSYENLLDPNDDSNDFKAFLLAKSPDGLTTTLSEEYGYSFGFSQSDGFALVSLKLNKCIYNGNPNSLDILKEWIKEWNSCGQPGYKQLKLLGEKGKDGWRISLKI